VLLIDLDFDNSQNRKPDFDETFFVKQVIREARKHWNPENMVFWIASNPENKKFHSIFDRVVTDNEHYLVIFGEGENKIGLSMLRTQAGFELLKPEINRVLEITMPSNLFLTWVIENDGKGYNLHYGVGRINQGLYYERNDMVHPKFWFNPVPMEDYLKYGLNLSLLDPIIMNRTDQQSPYHLIQLFLEFNKNQNSNKNYQELSFEYNKMLKKLANKIMSKEWYHLLWYYYIMGEILDWVNLVNVPELEEHPVYQRLIHQYRQLVLDMFKLVCGLKKKWLYGVKDEPLWGPFPEIQKGLSLNELQKKHPAKLDDAIINTFRFMPILSGKRPQLFFDRVMIPDPTHYPANIAKWAKQTGLTPDSGCGEPVKMGDYEQILINLELNRKKHLVIDKPVMVKLENHAWAETVLFQQKTEHLILAKVTPLNGPEMLIQVSTRYLPVAPVNVDPKRTIDVINNADIRLEYFVLSLYQHLVIPEEITLEKPLVRRNSSKSKNTTGKPKWVLLPRKTYMPVTGRVEIDNITIEDRPLLPKEEKTQKFYRVYHEVGQFTRTLPPGHKPNPSKLASVPPGIVLEPGQTWVKPHTRGMAYLEQLMQELGDDDMINLEKIPRFLKRT
jgi:hypothetical protein